MTKGMTIQEKQGLASEFKKQYEEKILICALKTIKEKFDFSIFTNEIHHCNDNQFLIEFCIGHACDDEFDELYDHVINIHCHIRENDIECYVYDLEYEKPLTRFTVVK